MSLWRFTRRPEILMLGISMNRLNPNRHIYTTTILSISGTSGWGRSISSNTAWSRLCTSAHNRTYIQEACNVKGHTSDSIPTNVKIIDDQTTSSTRGVDDVKWLGSLCLGLMMKRLVMDHTRPYTDLRLPLLHQWVLHRQRVATVVPTRQ